jgi:hypothetical protein
MQIMHKALTLFAQEPGSLKALPLYFLQCLVLQTRSLSLRYFLQCPRAPHPKFAQFSARTLYSFTTELVNTDG